MGRGERAVAARELLYGRRRRGPGPREVDRIEVFRIALAGGHLPRIEGVDARLSEVISQDDPFGSYVQAKINNVWDKPTDFFFFDRKDKTRIVFDFSMATTMAATGQEIKFLHGLGSSLPPEGVQIEFAFSRSGQIMSFMSLYDSDNFSLGGAGDKSDGEALAEMSDSEALDDLEREYLQNQPSLSDAWRDPIGRNALQQLSENGEFWLMTTPQGLVAATSS